VERLVRFWFRDKPNWDLRWALLPSFQYSLLTSFGINEFIIETLSNVEIWEKIPEVPFYDKGRLGHSQMPIRPGGKFTMNGVQGDIVTSEQYFRVNRGKFILFTWGKIVYCDVFKKHFVVGFGARYTPDGFVPVDEYNYIDEYKEGSEAN